MGKTVKKTASKKKGGAADHAKGAVKTKSAVACEIAGVVLVLLGVLFGLAAYTEISALLIVWFKKVTFGLFGILGYAAPVTTVATGVAMIIYGKRSGKLYKPLMGILGVLSLMAIIHLCYVSKLDFSKSYFKFLSESFELGHTEIIGCGFFGGILSRALHCVLGVAGSVCVLAAILIISVILVFDISLKNIGMKIGKLFGAGEGKSSEKAARVNDARANTDYGYVEQPVRNEPQYDEVRISGERYSEYDERRAYDGYGHNGYGNNGYGNNGWDYSYDDEYAEVKKHIKKQKKHNILLGDLTIEPKKEETDEAASVEEYGYVYDTYTEPAEPDYSNAENYEQKAYEGEFDYAMPVSEKAEEDNADEKNAGLTIIGKDVTGALPKKKRVIPAVYSAELMNSRYPDYEASVGNTADEGEDAHELSFGFDEPPRIAVRPVKRMPAADGIRQSADNGSVKADTPARTVRAFTKDDSDGYSFPPVELLDEGSDNYSPLSAEEEMRSYSEKLEDTLKSFGVSAKVINTERGPKVTRYELQPAPGVKISRIVNLSNDIALNLAAESIRIEAPIPGKAAIGIELPNREKANVVARDLIDTADFRSQKSALSFALGKDIMGRNVYADLSKMPHLLVAGTTGSGKSVCLNMIIMSLLFRTTPQQVKLMLIDPKRGVEMAKYNGIPNLITPVVTEPAKAAGALAWAVSEMINRYKSLNTTGSRNIEKHNEILISRGEEPLPKLVIVIDEFADLMMISSKEVEEAVCRIAQLGRASGIHLVIATQSPRADIFTGLIKANVPSRIALTVGNSLESRIIMDSAGAEALLGAGDMLFRPIGVNKPVRVQGCWVSDGEIENVVEYLKTDADIEYDSELADQIEKLAEQSGKKDKKPIDDAGEGFEDDLTQKAIKIALDYDGVSASMLQRRLRVGYARASRLVDELEGLGIVGPADGSKPRQLLITHEDYMRRYGASEEEIMGDIDD